MDSKVRAFAENALYPEFWTLNSFKIFTNILIKTKAQIWIWYSDHDQDSDNNKDSDLSYNSDFSWDQDSGLDEASNTSQDSDQV